MKRWLIFVLILSAMFLIGYFVIASGSKKKPVSDRSKEQPSDKNEKPNIVVSIEGMTCGLCTAAVTKSLYKVDGIKKVSVSLKDGKAYITAGENVKDSEIQKAVERAGGYRVTAIKRTGGSS